VLERSTLVILAVNEHDGGRDLVRLVHGRAWLERGDVRRDGAFQVIHAAFDSRDVSLLLGTVIPPSISR